MTTPDARPGHGRDPMDGREPSTPPAASPGTVRFALLLTAGMLVLDQATKVLAEELLIPGAYVPLLGDGVGWQLVYNPGGAFGLPAPAWLFLVVTAIVAVIVLRALPQTTSLTQAGAYALLLAGALGNVVDRLLRDGGETFGSGYVVDFVAWGSFPRFNVADASITVGFVLLVLALWIEERAQGSATPAEATDER